MPPARRHLDVQDYKIGLDVLELRHGGTGVIGGMDLKTGLGEDFFVKFKDAQVVVHRKDLSHYLVPPPAAARSSVSILL